MKKLLITLVVLIIIAGTVGGTYLRSRKAAEPQVLAQEVTRGDIVQAVGATGTVEAVKTVDVGTQVTGVIKEMYADFNSIVKKDQLVARIDPANIEAQIERDKANLESQMASLERQKVAVEDSQNKLRRARDLFDRKLLTQQDLETAEVTVKTNLASLKAQQASIKQIEAQLNQDQVNLGYTNIYAPIDGIVINRKVDIGQTVVSNNAATSMYQIAQDLTKMQLKVSVDESDVGMLRPGQLATFRVDAYLEKQFTGTVSQVRLQPVVTQNVVTYVTIIDVPNPNLELKPGMTANVTIEITRRANALRIPVGALRFRPTSEVLLVLNLPTPPEMLQRGRTAIAQNASVVQVANDEPTTGIAQRGASTIDALFGELKFESVPGRVWVYSRDAATNAHSLKAVSVRTGISDGTYAELLEGPGLEEGKMLMTGLDTGQQNRPGSNPLMPGRGGPMGGFGGGHGGPH